MRIEFSRIITMPYFYVGIVLCCLFCFTMETYAGGETFSQSLLQVLPGLGRRETIDIELLNPCILIQGAVTGYLSLFAPVLTSIPYVISYSEEKKTRYKYYRISRTSLKSYYCNKWAAGILGGGIVMLIGCFLFHLCLLIFFPQLGSGSEYLHSVGISGSMQLLFYIQIYLGLFFYGMISVLPAIILSVFCNNLYFLICIPFLVTFFWNLFVSRLSEWIIYTYKGEHITLATINYLYSTSIVDGFTSLLKLPVTVIQLTGCIFLLLCLYYIMISHALDCGE